MKNYAPNPSRPPARSLLSRSSFRLSLIFATACLGLLASVSVSVHAQSAPGIEISVRSGIDPAEKTRRDQDPARAHDRTKQGGHVYVLASVKEETWEVKLIKPVDALSIAKEVKRQLQKQGFREAGPKEKPDIVITVKYGRGIMPDPYINPDFLDIKDPRKFAVQRVGLSDDDPAAHFQTHEVFVGIDAKIAALDEEKLAIQVRAWKYPPPADPKKKAELAWMTTMYADDPDHHDLNLIMPQLLAAGAPYFNQHLDREHPVEIDTALPDGHVNVGTPEVVEPDAPKSK